MKRKKVKEESKIEEKKREPYTFIAHVSGPVFKYEVKGTDIEEAYATGMQILRKDLEKYEGKVITDKLEIIKYGDLYF